MKRIAPSLAIICVCFLSGCYAGNNAKAEKATDEMISLMSDLCTGLENGDKTKIQTMLTRAKQLTAEMKDVKITKSKETELKNKMETAMNNLKPRMEQAMVKALSSGKFTQAELLKLGTDLQSLGK